MRRRGIRGSRGVRNGEEFEIDLDVPAPSQPALAARRFKHRRQGCSHRHRCQPRRPCRCRGAVSNRSAIASRGSTAAIRIREVSQPFLLLRRRSSRHRGLLRKCRRAVACAATDRPSETPQQRLRRDARGIRAGRRRPSTGQPRRPLRRRGTARSLRRRRRRRLRSKHRRGSLVVRGQPEPAAEYMAPPVVEAVAAVEAPEPVAEVPSPEFEAPASCAELPAVVAAAPCGVRVRNTRAPVFETPGAGCRNGPAGRRGRGCGRNTGAGCRNGPVGRRGRGCGRNTGASCGSAFSRSSKLRRHARNCRLLWPRRRRRLCSSWSRPCSTNTGSLLTKIPPPPVEAFADHAELPFRVRRSPDADCDAVRAARGISRGTRGRARCGTGAGRGAVNAQTVVGRAGAASRPCCRCRETRSARPTSSRRRCRIPR